MSVEDNAMTKQAKWGWSLKRNYVPLPSLPRRVASSTHALVAGGASFYFLKINSKWAAKIDKRDIPLVCQYHWTFQGKARCRYVYSSSGPGPRILLHRLILNAKPGQIVDHKNGNSLDNRRSNLRIVTHSENQKNRNPKSDHND
mgnify:CR=1 FL=1